MNQTLVVTGGGSGGHITPILAVATELKRQRPGVKIVYIGQRGDGLADIPAAHPAIDEVRAVFAGKFRRYHGEGWQQLLNLVTLFKNIRDGLYVVIGIVQSWLLLRKLQPAVVFSRGAFVSVPVCLGAALCHVPYITHDSDAQPSLANRIIARWAIWHAVALTADVYPYPAKKTVTTGIPLAAEFVPVTPQLRQQYRRELQLAHDDEVIFIIGGGLGSQRVNDAVADILPHLLADFPRLRVIHAVGRANQLTMEEHYDNQLSAAQRGRVAVQGFIEDVYRYSGAADIVITRAGATNLAEFSVQGKACIVIPSPFLAAGHQMRNAEYLAEQGAAVVVNEAEMLQDPNRLAKQVVRLLRDPAVRHHLEHQLATFAHPDATTALAALIIKQLDA